MRCVASAALRIILGFLLFSGCQSPEPRDPEAAFERLRVATTAHDSRLLYHALDTESRWALDAVWGYQREMAAIAAPFPPEARARVLARVDAARASANAGEFLGRQTTIGDPFARLGGGAGLGTKVSVVRDRETARVRTSTGLELPMAPGSDGIWGWAGLRDELVRWRHVTSNDLERLKVDAQVYGRASGARGK